MKLEERLNELGIQRVQFYYEGEITVCLLFKDGETLSRGVTICSPLDNFVKRQGRNIALGRAIQAAVREETTGRVNILKRKWYDNTSPDLILARDTFVFKSCYYPILTSREQGIVENGAKRDGKNKRKG